MVENILTEQNVKVDCPDCDASIEYGLFEEHRKTCVNRFKCLYCDEYLQPDSVIDHLQRSHSSTVIVIDGCDFEISTNDTANRVINKREFENRVMHNSYIDHRTDCATIQRLNKWLDTSAATNGYRGFRFDTTRNSVGMFVMSPSVQYGTAHGYCVIIKPSSLLDLPDGTQLPSVLIRFFMYATQFGYLMLGFTISFLCSDARKSYVRRSHPELSLAYRCRQTYRQEETKVEESGQIKNDVLFDSKFIHHFRSWNQDYHVITRAPSYNIGDDTYPNTKLVLSLGLGDQIIHID